MNIIGHPCELKNAAMFCELNKDDFHKARTLSNLTISHLRKPPCFMPGEKESLQSFMEDITADVRMFAAKKDGEIVAYLKTQNEGETFISENINMQNITGTYVLDKYRGMNIASDLLEFVIKSLQKDGYTHLGVDYESINPTANSFWRKHFTPYTYSLTRRIDERIIE